MVCDIFTLCFLLLPLITWNGRYEAPKIIVFLIACLLLALNLIINKRKEIIKVIKLSDLFYFIWIIILNFSSLYGVHPIDSILGGSYRHQGVVFFIALWILAKAFLLLPQKYKDLINLGFIPVVIYEAILVIFQGIFYKGRPLGTLGEPNASAGFLAISIPFLLLGLAKLNEKKYFLWVLLVFILVAVFFSGSRAAIISLLSPLVYLVSILLTGVNPIKKIFQKITYILIVLAVGLFATLIIKQGFNQRENSQFENRPLIWKFAAYKIIQRPLLGYGAESGEYIYEQAYKQAEKPLMDLMVDRAHNLFLDVILWSGLIGLVFFVGWLISEAIILIKNKKWLKFAGLISFLIFSFFQPLGVVHWIILVLILN